ncbi:hypothetical protein D0T90_08610 [Neisseria animalis]|uniref:Uncharacterized protein n=1 Tax=Neisseria animalis TaxID=492 RepID=A0A5P3MSE3_NEIAN|nr:hypothetical protein D0T90_08610 [Neisseria animalis]ROW33061.1 hypothetical protein CGZ60_02105 [Neisseria animalis]
MPCRTMCTVCGFAALSHSYFIRLYFVCFQNSRMMRVVRENRFNSHFIPDYTALPYLPAIPPQRKA